jgi:isoleucyl-tRNA synthetase
VIVNDMLLDRNGQKMSKSRGNVVNPFEVITKHGADATRW